MQEKDPDHGKKMIFYRFWPWQYQIVVFSAISEENATICVSLRMVESWKYTVSLYIGGKEEGAAFNVV